MGVNPMGRLSNHTIGQTPIPLSLKGLTSIFCGEVVAVALDRTDFDTGEYFQFGPHLNGRPFQIDLGVEGATFWVKLAAVVPDTTIYVWTDGGKY